MIRNPLEQFMISDLISLNIIDILKISLTNIGLIFILQNIIQKYYQIMEL
jgi:hypothetical protein